MFWLCGKHNTEGCDGGTERTFKSSKVKCEDSIDYIIDRKKFTTMDEDMNLFEESIIFTRNETPSSSISNKILGTSNVHNKKCNIHSDSKNHLDAINTTWETLKKNNINSQINHIVDEKEINSNNDKEMREDNQDTYDVCGLNLQGISRLTRNIDKSAENISHEMHENKLKNKTVSENLPLYLNAEEAAALVTLCEVSSDLDGNVSNNKFENENKSVDTNKKLGWIQLLKFQHIFLNNKLHADQIDGPYIEQFRMPSVKLNEAENDEQIIVDQIYDTKDDDKTNDKDDKKNDINHEKYPGLPSFSSIISSVKTTIENKSKNVAENLGCLGASIREGDLNALQIQVVDLINKGGPELNGLCASVKVGLGVTTVVAGHYLFGAAMIVWGTGTIGGAILWGLHRNEVKSWMENLTNTNSNTINKCENNDIKNDTACRSNCNNEPSDADGNPQNLCNTCKSKYFHRPCKYMISSSSNIFDSETPQFTIKK